MSQPEISGKRKMYKYRELKCYSSTEWLIENQKKYRQVFDKFEVGYVYAELSFYNKLYDEEDWKANIELKCFKLNELNQRIELCALHFDHTIHKYDNLVYLREGWGNKMEGNFWSAGTYYWEAYINGEKEGTKYFYIIESEQPYKKEVNNYFGLESIKLYEGSYGDVAEDERIYCVEFSSTDSQFIYMEMNCENKILSLHWQCEVFVRIFNESRELKGQVTKLINVRTGDKQIRFTAGWGTNVKGNWKEGNYTFEVVFMDMLVAIVPFKVDEYTIQGTPNVFLSDNLVPLNMVNNISDDESFDSLMVKLDSYIGLSEIKNRLRQHASYLNFLELRKSKGLESQTALNIHSVFIGNPGTGKTTIAGYIGLLYKKMGLLSKGHVVEVDRVDLIGEYIGQTAPKVKQAIDLARGGVLFIDEAYALARTNDDSKDFGREVIEILVKEMSAPDCNFAVIVAGYPKEMKHFLNSNPGLKSRFKITYEFPDYMPQELSEIAEFVAVQLKVNFVPKAKLILDEIIMDAFRKKDKSFGNARFVYDLVEKAKINLGIRIMESKEPSQLSENDLSMIKEADVIKLKQINLPMIPKIPIDESLLKETLRELDALIGMKELKRDIHEIIAVTKFQMKQGHILLNKYYYHTLFIGNPGTGKTTVARIMAKLFKSLGVLERGHLVETDRQGLVAGFVGHTATKTSEKIDDALGGVLFIDEAYALTANNSFNDYGQEAIQTLIKRMEDDRGKFFLFAAGYPDNMEAFIKSNPGLSSRFDKTLKFHDYNPEELLEIAIKMFTDSGNKLTAKAESYLGKYIIFIYQYRDKYFGNARTVRLLVDEILKKHQLRLSLLADKPVTKKNIHLIVLEDVNFLIFKPEEIAFTRKRIGFRGNS